MSSEQRFNCPFPGCQRSFAELWRLKVHYRSPPDVRGSGKERGHGVELQSCPRCLASLQPGRHHVGCSAGPVAPRQAAKRMQAAQNSSESPPLSSSCAASAKLAKRPYHKRSDHQQVPPHAAAEPRRDSDDRERPTMPSAPVDGKPAAPSAAAAQPSTADNPLEPHMRLEAVAARLAASVGDASELVTAARMLQNDGGVPASVLRQLSLALRQIGTQQANALEEAASLLDSAAAARLLLDASGATPPPPPGTADGGAETVVDASPRPLSVAERRAINQLEGTADDEAAAGAADAARRAAALPPPSGGYAGFRVAPDLVTALRGQRQAKEQLEREQAKVEAQEKARQLPASGSGASGGNGNEKANGGASGSAGRPGESSTTCTSSGAAAAAAAAPAAARGGSSPNAAAAAASVGVLSDECRKSLSDRSNPPRNIDATLAPPPPLTLSGDNGVGGGGASGGSPTAAVASALANGNGAKEKQLLGGSAVAAAFLSGRT